MCLMAVYWLWSNLIKLLSINQLTPSTGDAVIDVSFAQIMHRNKYKTNKLIGSFKLDVATVWYQKGKMRIQLSLFSTLMSGLFVHYSWHVDANNSPCVLVC